MKVTVDNKLYSVSTKFQKDHPNIVKDDKNIFSRVVLAAQEIEREFLIQDGEYKLPERLGELRIVKTKVKAKYRTLLVNHIESKRLKKNVIHFNDHSDGYVYKVKWFRTSKNISEFVIWKFKTGRHLARAIAYTIKNKLNDYSIDI